MVKPQELVLSAADAELLDHLRREQATEVPDALDELLMEARVVPDENVPPDRVRVNADVAYQEEAPGGARRKVTLVHPAQANAAEGRISVLSPVGLSLLGRAPGTAVDAVMPSGRALKIRIEEVEKPLS